MKRYHPTPSLSLRCGAGLGPTLEFYTLLSHELQRRSLGIWRHSPAPAGSADDGAKPAVVEADAPAAAAPAAAAAEGGGGGGAPPAAAAAAARRQSGPGPLAGELGEEAGQHEGVKASELVVAPQGLFPAPLPPGQRGDDSKVSRLIDGMGERGWAVWSVAVMQHLRTARPRPCTMLQNCSPDLDAHCLCLCPPPARPLIRLQAVAHFRLLGRAVAKALQDNRLLDLPLSPLFYRLALQRRVDLFDIRRLDSSLGEHS